MPPRPVWDQVVAALLDHTPVGTYLYRRRLYEVMLAREALSLDDQPPVMRDFAQMWRAAEKIVYSGTLATVSSVRTRIERDLRC